MYGINKILCKRGPRLEKAHRLPFRNAQKSSSLSNLRSHKYIAEHHSFVTHEKDIENAAQKIQISSTFACGMNNVYWNEKYIRISLTGNS